MAKLGKLSLAILENFVESALGEKFVDELREPTDRALAIASALEQTQERFLEDYTDRVFAENILNHVEQTSLGLLSDVVGSYFDHPTDPKFKIILKQIVTDSFPAFSKTRVNKGINQYVVWLTEELALADADFREKVKALAELRSGKSQQEMVSILRRVEVLLSQRGTSTAEATVFLSLHQLPQPPADFTGREKLIEDLLKAFENHKGATISGLTGMGGIGKTALGLEVAHKIAENYPDAQIFLDLKGTTTSLSATDIMRHVILSFEPTADLRALDDANMSAAYQSVLHGKKVLLFLDNARSAEQIAPLRPPDACTMLVTSRWTFPVMGLKTHKVGVLQENEAVDFLLELCPRVSDKAADLAKVCAYLPLALRIAGSFLQVNSAWSIEKYMQQLSDRKQRLETFRQNRKDAELTTEPDLLATFELSYNQLTEEERKYWRMLGVFSTSFDWSAAQGMWELEEDKATKLLSLLKRYSLLECDEASIRYGLHDLLADFAFSQLEAGEERAARIQHALYYLELMNYTNRLYKMRDENILLGLRLFDSEWENINSAQVWVVGNMDLSETVTELAMHYPSASPYCLDLRLTPRQKIGWLTPALLAAKKLSQKDWVGIYLGNIGRAYLALGDSHRAIEFFEQALVLDREMDSREWEGADLGNLGNAYYSLGNIRKAIEYFEHALVIYRDVGNRRDESNILNNLGGMYLLLGEVQKAITFFEQRLDIAREIGDYRGMSSSLGNLGVAYYGLGNKSKAIEFYEQTLLIADQLGDRKGESSALYNIGLVLYDMDEKEKAVDLVKQALKIYEAIESPNAKKVHTTLKKWGSLE